jgi:hypothetical protein
MYTEPFFSNGFCFLLHYSTRSFHETCHTVCFINRVICFMSFRVENSIVMSMLSSRKYLEFCSGGAVSQKIQLSSTFNGPHGAVSQKIQLSSTLNEPHVAMSQKITTLVDFQRTTRRCVPEDTTLAVCLLKDYFCIVSSCR